MTQVVLNINSEEKWNALKGILESMNIETILPGIIWRL